MKIPTVQIIILIIVLLLPGIYNITLAIDGYNALQTNVSISPGQVSTGFSFQLELNNTQLLDYTRPLIITVATPDYEKRLSGG
jgi:hypothetical protein